MSPQLNDGVAASSGTTRVFSCHPLPKAIKNLYMTKTNMDVIFIVGKERQEVKGHKLILCARSDILSLTLAACTSVDVYKYIEIPAINPNAFEQFIKFIYTDDVVDCLTSSSFHDTLHLSSLGEQYGFYALWDAANAKIAKDLVADYRNCFTALENKLDDDLNELAYAVLKRNLSTALSDNDMKIKWTPQIWRNVLTEDSIPPNVKEIHLFVALYKWKQHSPNCRHDVFQELLNLIRFPTMDAASIHKYVRPTGLLSSDVLLDMVLQGIGVNVTTNRPQQFRGDARSAKVIYVTSSLELNTALNCIPLPGRGNLEEDKTKIILLPGNYTGDLILEKQLVNLVGFGPYTIFKGRQSVLTIASHQNCVSNLTLGANMAVINVTGTLNSVKDIRVQENVTLFALGVTGSNNCFKNFNLQYKPASSKGFVGSTTHGQNSVDNCGFLTLCRPLFGLNFRLDNRLYISRVIWSDGAKNTFSSFECVTPVSRHRTTAFTILKAGNAIENVNCCLKNNLEFKRGAILSVEPNVTDLYVSDCAFESLKCQGDKNWFRKIIVSGSVQIFGMNNRFSDCHSGVFADNGKNTLKKDCELLPPKQKPVVPLPMVQKVVPLAPTSQK